MSSAQGAISNDGLAAASASVAQDKKKFAGSGKKKGKQQQQAVVETAEAEVTTRKVTTSSSAVVAAAVTATTTTTTTTTASSADTPTEPEQHVDGDAVESAMRKLKGTRPDLLRTSTYYEGAKNVYMCLAGLPVLSSIAPTVEAATESLINMTPLKPSPEEQAEQKSVAVLDKRIREVLSYADEVVDVKKDEAIEGIVSVKKVVHTIGPVQSVVGAACSVGDGVGKAYGSANDTAGNVWHQVLGTVSQACSEVTAMAGNTVHNVSSTAGSAVNHVTAATGEVVNSAKTTTGSTVDSVKSMVGSTTESIGSNVNWATSTAMSLIGTAIAYPMGVVKSFMGTSNSGADGGVTPCIVIGRNPELVPPLLQCPLSQHESGNGNPRACPSDNGKFN